MIMNEKMMWGKVEMYNKKFEEGFPTFQLAGKTKEEICEIIDDCIKQSKDVYELGYLVEDEADW